MKKHSSMMKVAKFKKVLEVNLFSQVEVIKCYDVQGCFFFVLGLASFKNEESLMLTALFFFFFSGKPEMATINSSPEGLYRNSYNLTWSIKSSSPLEKVRILFRKMVSRYILHILLRRSSKFQCCQFRNYVVTTISKVSFHVP